MEWAWPLGRGHTGSGRVTREKTGSCSPPPQGPPWLGVKLWAPVPCKTLAPFQEPAAACLPPQHCSAVSLPSHSSLWPGGLGLGESLSICCSGSVGEQPAVGRGH